MYIFFKVHDSSFYEWSRIKYNYYFIKYISTVNLLDPPQQPRTLFVASPRRRSTFEPLVKRELSRDWYLSFNLLFEDIIYAAVCVM